MIYLVEDDNSIRELVIYTLQSTGLEAAGFACGKDFWGGMKAELPSLILLDIMLPDEDGLTILKKIRNTVETAKIPVIMLTAKGTEYDKVVGLDSGADDYIPKPFGMMELVSRVKAVLRRTEPEQKTRLYEIGPIKVNVIRHTVHVNGEPVNLTYKEFELLCYLMENEGIVLSRDQLLSKIWGYDFDGETRTVDVHIRTLRQKLGIGGNYIETIRGVGYKIEEI
ncbi:DNA-binding response regulator [Clostridium sp. chh4-2]|uniref:response regulator transcription factor n=1 Tax=Clostridium sp. chh4-2 TaxID=2067550 RepID=UPI000CCDE14F|nr:response regulator transcription factor [Clostridium sp. chh4-2]PNV62271.1 DNA-binding response regulator [Clostridium sp. chh4-2]